MWQWLISYVTHNLNIIYGEKYQIYTLQAAKVNFNYSRLSSDFEQFFLVKNDFLCF